MQPKGATLFVTFRLAGSLPQAAIAQLRAARETEMHVATTNEDVIWQKGGISAVSMNNCINQLARTTSNSQRLPKLWPTASITATSACTD
ncbi:MAG: hypothetical protein H6653_00380 [Ardenticatenaceae bacterium]|nr:hypothetical protein [Ardenticatenaceae bacterium]